MKHYEVRPFLQTCRLSKIFSFVFEMMMMMMMMRVLLIEEYFSQMCNLATGERWAEGL